MAAFIWSEIWLVALTRGTGTLRSFSGPPGDNTLLLGVMHEGRHCNKKRAAERNMEGDVAFPQYLFKISHPFPRQQVKDLVWRWHFCKWIHYGSSCKVALREACSSRKPRTTGTLVLDLSQVMLSRSCGVLCKPVNPGSQPMQCISLESSSMFSDCICKSKKLLFYPMNHSAMQTIISK